MLKCIILLTFGSIISSGFANELHYFNERLKTLCELDANLTQAVKNGKLSALSPPGTPDNTNNSSQTELTLTDDNPVKKYMQDFAKLLEVFDFVCGQQLFLNEEAEKLVDEINELVNQSTS